MKERQLQIVSVSTQASTSRRVSRFKLQLRDRQEVRRGRGGDDRQTHTDGVGMELGFGLGSKIRK